MRSEMLPEQSSEDEKFHRRVDLAFGSVLLLIATTWVAGLINVYYGTGWDPLEIRRSMSDPTSYVVVVALILVALVLGIWKTIAGLRGRRKPGPATGDT